MAELHLYDFDSTLFRSPHQPAIWDGDWWSDPASLMEPCVPDRPNKAWWIPHTVETAKKSISDPNVFAVMMTGRKDNSAFRYRVPELLKQQRLTFDAVHLTPKTAKSAKKYKIEQVLRYLQQYPQIKKVQIWDDRKSHLQFFERVLRHFGYRVKTHFVHDISREPSCDTMKGVSSPKAPKKPRYVGIFLTGASKSALINAVGGYLHDVPKAEHITLGFKLTPELEGMLGQKVRFQVEGIAEDVDGQAVVVDLGHNSDLFKKKGVPHITISHSDRVAPKYSNDLLAKGSRPLHPHILFEGIVDTFPSSFTREVVRDNPRRRKMRRSKRGAMARRNAAPAGEKYINVLFSHPEKLWYDSPRDKWWAAGNTTLGMNVARFRFKVRDGWSLKNREDRRVLEELLHDQFPYDFPYEPYTIDVAEGIISVDEDESLQREKVPRSIRFDDVWRKYGHRLKDLSDAKARAAAIEWILSEGPLDESVVISYFPYTDWYEEPREEEDIRYSVYDVYTPAELGVKMGNNPSRRTRSSRTGMRRNPVRKQGDKWAVIKPDGSVDLLLGDEKVARRLAVACGYDSTPSSSQPVSEPRATKKKTPKNRTPRRKKRQKGAASGVHSASRKLRLTGGGVIGDQDGLRPFLVAEVAPNKFRAFYMSTGRNTPGMTPTGTWVHFGGIAAKGLVAEDGRAVGRSFDGWFIKPREKYGSKRAYPAITKQLALQVGNNVPLALSNLRYIFGQNFLEVDYDRMGADGVGLRVNAYLAKRGAIDAYAGSEEAEYKRGMGHKYLKEGVAPAHIGARTVYAAPRMRFNSNRGRYRMRSNPAYRGGAISPDIQQMTDIDLCKAWNSMLDLDFDERREGRHFTYENEIEELEREIDYRADGEDMDDWCTSILRAKSNPRRFTRRRRKGEPPAERKYIQVIFAHPDDPHDEFARHRMETHAHWSKKDISDRMNLDLALTRKHWAFKLNDIGKGILTIASDDDIRRYRSAVKNMSQHEKIQNVMAMYGQRIQGLPLPYARAAALSHVILSGPVEETVYTNIFQHVRDSDDLPEDYANALDRPHPRGARWRRRR